MQNVVNKPIFKVFSLVMLVAATFSVSEVALAKRVRTLIVMDGSTPEPGLAKSWKASPGKIEFTLDTTKEIKKGETVNFEAVKTTLEKRMKKYKAEVSGSGSSVILSYKGDEADVLKKLSKTKIKSAKKVALAMQSSMSDSGIRAKTSDRDPKAGEVKAVVSKSKGGQTRVTIAKVGAGVKGFKVGTPVRLKTPSFKGKPTQTVFFKPIKKVGKEWEVKDITDK